jgi:hypothetical protein
MTVEDVSITKKSEYLERSYEKKVPLEVYIY